MKKLKEYNKNGFKFTLLKRIGDIAAFEGVRESGAITFEVIHIQSHDGREIHGNVVVPSEYPPSNAQWGSKGWTYQTDSGAQDRFYKEVEKLDNLKGRQVDV
tara:strand:- start:410 stop:715 length:306 start_codon:yes stop_codon:yes gene_type:complete